MSDAPVFDPTARRMPAATLERLAAFARQWSGKEGTEQQLSQSFLNGLCDALGTPRPYAGQHSVEDYCFEKRVDVPDRSERGRIDLYKRGCFVLEAKCGRNTAASPGSAPVRGGKRYVEYIQSAWLDQAKVYAALLPEGPPPLLVVVDVGYHFWIWRGTDGRFDAFHSPRRLSFSIDAIADEENARVLWACFESPGDLDPSRAQQRITEDAVSRIAPLAARLEGRGHPPEDVARFLMRCLFCMFAEDVGLLPSGHFSKLLRGALQVPDAFEPEATRLFGAMDQGGLYGFERIRRFNGALFRDARALPLDRDALGLLAGAAALNWAFVDPAIFGTLLERALDPRERHRLGAHYTPRVFVERIVRATVEEPLRAEWDVVQARVEELRAAEPTETKANEAAQKVLLPFLRRLHDVRVLDPACGTGNFLYVAYAVLKELEHEVLSELVLAQAAQQGLLEGAAVVPGHMLGLEVKPWAAEIAQLVLWIGHLQWELHHGRQTTIRDPVLPEERSIACWDALIGWDRVAERRGPDGAVITRWDGLTTKVHHATGREVPDDTARVPVMDYDGVRRSAWPAATFIVGNPPFLGNKMMREALGDAYVEAVRGCYAEVGKTVDFVMYWWHRAADAVRAGQTERFGLITTNSIAQTFNRQVVEAHLAAEPGVGIVMAVPDHPWVDAGADVRIAMTVVERERPGVRRLSRLGRVVDEAGAVDRVELSFRAVPQIHADLSGGANVAGAVALRANEGLSFQGMNLVGKGFRLTREQVEALGFDVAALPPIIRPYLNARELMQTREGRFVIDAFGLTEEELRDAWPTAYQWLSDHVRPEREQNRRASRRERWWLFGEPVGKLRRALVGLGRYIATPETSKHRVFQFLDAATCPDHKLYAIPLDDPYLLGVLSARAHVLWSLEAGGRLGVGNDPVYNNTRCFLTYPFPAPTGALRAAVAELGERLDAHRKQAQARSPKATLTAMYNLLARHRAREPFTPAEQALHVQIGTDELLRLHDALDRAVLEAYGWPPDLSDDDLLARLVALNAERAAEERAGHVRWLRAPATEPASQPALALEEETADGEGPPPWPADPLDQLADILALLRSTTTPLDVESVSGRFKRAPRKRVSDLLSRLERRRLLVADDDGRYRVIA
ncbi:MAG: hypothetical protein AMXMBFR64_33110 [Myxococcales bacterium]